MLGLEREIAERKRAEADGHRAAESGSASSVPGGVQEPAALPRHRN
jgi:hypothetical protein